MAAILCKQVVNQKLIYVHYSSKVITADFSRSCIQLLDQKWRRARQLPENPNRRGVLTDKPDYSYLDGRPVELGKAVKSRLEKQKAYAEKIYTLSKEMDFAVERHKRLLQEKEEEKQRLLSSKLKPKGHLLLKPK